MVVFVFFGREVNTRRERLTQVSAEMATQQMILSDVALRPDTYQVHEKACAKQIS